MFLLLCLEVFGVFLLLSNCHAKSKKKVQDFMLRQEFHFQQIGLDEVEEKHISPVLRALH